MKKRTDLHRPSAIVPDEYEFIAFEYAEINGMEDCAYIQEQRARIKAHMTKTGGDYSRHEHGGNCHICGAWAKYTVLFYHSKTNTYIRTGQDCAAKMEMSYGSDWNAFRKAVSVALHARAGKRKAQALLSEAGLLDAWTIFTSTETEDYRKEERTIVDIVRKLVKYGSVSDKALAHVKRMLGWIAERPAQEAKRAAEREAAADCPSGRLEITGEVLTVRVDDTDFGPTTKVLVRDDRGFKVWGTRPTIKAGIDEHNQQCYDVAERGDRISFSAMVEPSDKDAKFGFYRRPTKGKMLSRAVTADSEKA